MPSRWFAFALFLSSYSPAFLIVAIRAVDRSCVFFTVALTIAVGSAGAFLLFLKVARQGGPFEAVVEDVEHSDSDLAAYVVTYLLPFLTVFDPKPQDVVALAVFLIFIGVLWINSGMVYLNPLLALVGYHVYVVRMRPAGAEMLDRSFLITKNPRLKAGDRVRPDRVSRAAYIDVPNRS